MASELFIFENSYFSDPFSPFSDSSIIDHSHHDNVLLNSEENCLVQESEPTHIDDSNSFDELASFLLSSSPPSHQLEYLSLCQTSSEVKNRSNSDSGYAELYSLDIKTEELHAPLEYDFDTKSSVPCYGSLGTSSNAAKLMQRSYSSNSFENKPNYLYQPSLGSLMESPNSQNQVVSSPESTSFSSNKMRRVCSTGDLHKIKTTATRNKLSPSTLARSSSFIEEAGNHKVEPYTAEERKERIERYRAKKTQRNFNKTIKYACRKTLADTRPRIRGRFARNDETGDIPISTMFTGFRYEDDEEFRVERIHEEEYDSMMIGKTPFVNNFNATQQYQYFGYSG